MWPAAAIVADQVRAIGTSAPLTESDPTPALPRAELMADTKHDSSSIVDAAAGRSPCTATAPMAVTSRRLRYAACLTGLLLRRSGGLREEVHDFASPGHPGFAFVERPCDQEPLRAAVTTSAPAGRRCMTRPHQSRGRRAAFLGDLLEQPSGGCGNSGVETFHGEGPARPDGPFAI